jgi:hypothetical protein
MVEWHELKDKHKDETCVVIGNGPSLRNIPLSFLQKYPTFGTNRIYLLEGFVPTYYACVNPLVLEQFHQDIEQVPAHAKFITDTDGWYKQIPGSLRLHPAKLPAFSYHPEDRIYEGFTVTFVCLQLAFYMGFKKVLLVGVDHSFQYQGGPNEERVMPGADPNHFAPEYFQGARWNNPDLMRSGAAYSQAYVIYDVCGREIINCSTYTELDVFPRADWREYA